MEQERLSIEILNLRPSSLDKLMWRKIDFCDQLTDLTSEEILAWHNVGPHTLRDIRKALAAKKMCLKGDFLADSEEQKNLIQNMPNLMQDIKMEVHRLQNILTSLSGDLEKLHINMRPYEKD
jgi:hypothetical protein